MAIQLDLDLQAGDVYTELAGIETLLKSMGADMRSIDLDFGGDIASITEEILELVDALEVAEDKLSRMSKDLKAAAEAWKDVDFGIHQFPGAAKTTEKQEGASKGGGGGGKTAATDGGLKDLNNKLSRLFGGRADGKGLLSDRDIMRQLTGFQRGGVFNLGAHGPDFRGFEKGRGFGAVNDMAGRTARRNMFGGMDSAKMAGRRAAAATDGIDFSVGTAATAGHPFDFMDGDNEKKSRLGRFFGKAGKLDNVLDGVSDRLKSMMPTMKKWWQLIAMLIPLLISFAVNALGVAAALGAMVVAGGALIGLGLIGHANDMGAAMEEAKNQIQSFKKELFETFSPTAQLFAPIQEEFFDFAPDALSGVAREMEGLVQFDDLLFNMFSALAGGVEEFFAIINRNGALIEQLSIRFGGLIGQGLLDFFEWLIHVGYENQQMLVALGAVLVHIMAIIFNLSQALATFISLFEPVFAIVAKLSSYLQNDLVSALFMTGMTLGVVILALTKMLVMLAKVQLAMQILGLTGLGSIATMAKGFIGYMGAMMASVWGMIASLGALRAALVMTGIGALLVGGGLLLNEVLKKTAPMPTPASTQAGGFDYGGGSKSAPTQVVNNYSITNRGGDTASQQNLFTEIKRSHPAMQPPEAGARDRSQTDRNAGNNTDFE